jgi:hypothetical protein
LNGKLKHDYFAKQHSTTENNRGKKNARLGIFTVVTMKNAFFWDIENQFVPDRKHIMSLLQSPTG